MSRRELKVGMILWYVYFDEEGCSLEEYVISIIRRKKIPKWLKHDGNQGDLTVFLIHKIQGVTWVKKSKKHYDYGWASGIDECWKKNFKMDDYLENGLSGGFSFTKAGAYKEAVSRWKGEIKRYKGYLKEKEEEEAITEWEEIISDYDKVLKTMKSRYMKEKNKR